MRAELARELALTRWAKKKTPAGTDAPRGCHDLS
jgi:hypothetical protein